MAKRGKSEHEHPESLRAWLAWCWVYVARRSTRFVRWESIPDQDLLFFRVHKSYVRNGDIIPGAFRDQGIHPLVRGMSTDWNKYSTPEESRWRARTPSDNGIASLDVGAVRAIPGLAVDHDPYWSNRAHTHVLGEKDTEARLKLKRLCRWVIRIP